MRRTSRAIGLMIVCVGVLLARPVVAQGQLSASAAWTAVAGNNFRVVSNVTYFTADNYENKLDVYVPRNVRGPTPVVMYFHGGGWRIGSKDSQVFDLLPYLEMGFAVVNVEYRRTPQALAPAAVEDCLCALRWVVLNSKEYNFDTARIITTGTSAGGHLALTTGMIPPSAGLDRQCPEMRFRGLPSGTATLKLGAIINWYGITDVVELLGENGTPERPYEFTTDYAVNWLGSRPDRVEMAKRMSPLTYVRPGLPPVLSIQGDKDQRVPYAHAVRLHEALTKAGVKNELFTVPGGGHGGFTREERLKIFQAMHRFLSEHGLLPSPSAREILPPPPPRSREKGGIE